MNWYWLRDRVHLSWHLTTLCLGVMIGVASVHWLQDVDALSSLILATILCAVSLPSRRRFLLLFIFIAGVLVGLARGSVGLESFSEVKTLYGQEISLTGTVSDDVESNSRELLIVRLDNLQMNGVESAGSVYATVSTDAMIERGDGVRLRGEMNEGFGSFVGTMYDASLISLIKTSQKDLALRMRNDFAEHVGRAIDEPAASLGMGYLLGQKRQLSRDLQEALKIVGLTHIVVASGYNLTILVRLTRRLFSNVSKYLTALVSGGLIAVFVMITGLSPSMSRAGMVTGLALFAWYYGRAFHPVTMLTVVGAISVLLVPSYAWGDVGWLLSMTAFAGVMLIAPVVQRFFFGEGKIPFLGQLLIETLSAQVATIPIILYTFGTFSHLALIGNMIIVPFVPLAMLLVAIAGIGAYLLPPLAGVIGAPAELLLSIMIRLVEWFADVPNAQEELTINWIVVVVMYAVIAVIWVTMKWRTGTKLYATSIVE